MLYFMLFLLIRFNRISAYKLIRSARCGDFEVDGA